MKKTGIIVVLFFLMISSVAPVEGMCKNREAYEICKACTRGYPTDLNFLALTKNVHTRDEHGGTPLYYACMNGHFAVAELLLQKGVDVNEKHRQGMSPLLVACARANMSNNVSDLKIVALLLARGANVSASGALVEACSSGYTALVRLLLRNGADAHKKNVVDDASFIKACHFRYFDIIKLLIAHGAKISNNCPKKYKCMVNDFDRICAIVEFRSIDAIVEWKRLNGSRRAMAIMCALRSQCLFPKAFDVLCNDLATRKELLACAEEYGFDKKKLSERMPTVLFKQKIKQWAVSHCCQCMLFNNINNDFDFTPLSEA